MSKWISIDPATKSGVATWIDGILMRTDVVKARGKSGLWYGRGGEVFDSRLDAWNGIYENVTQVIIERGFGGMATAVRSQGKHIGWHECMCAFNMPAPIEVNVSEWRRVIKEDQGISWPSESKRCKALSVKLARNLYGLDLSDDESDAVLIGRAAMRMGLIETEATA